MTYDYTADVDLTIAVERDDEAGARENAWAILARPARGLHAALPSSARRGVRELGGLAPRPGRPDLLL